MFQKSPFANLSSLNEARPCHPILPSNLSIDFLRVVLHIIVELFAFIFEITDLVVLLVATLIIRAYHEVIEAHPNLVQVVTPNDFLKICAHLVVFLCY